MSIDLDNWRTQIRKGYLELCLLALLHSRKRLYGFELLEILEQADLPVKEGTLYPMLNRMTAEGTLSAVWETENLRATPQILFLTREGLRLFESMRTEYEKMTKILKSFEK